MVECRKHSDWDKWKAAIEAELRSLYEREASWVCSPNTSKVIPEGCKWVFLLKRNKHGTKRGRWHEGSRRDPTSIMMKLTLPWWHNVLIYDTYGS